MQALPKQGGLSHNPHIQRQKWIGVTSSSAKGDHWGLCVYQNMCEAQGSILNHHPHSRCLIIYFQNDPARFVSFRVKREGCGIQRGILIAKTTLMLVFYSVLLPLGILWLARSSMDFPGCC